MEICLTDIHNPNILQLFSEYDDFMFDFLGEDHIYYSRFHAGENLEAIWLALCNGKPAGCAAFRMRTNNVGEVKRMFVKPSYRKKGIARELLSHVINHAQVHKCYSLFLDTRITLIPAVSLYQSFGFIQMYQDGLYIQMSKPLH